MKYNLKSTRVTISRQRIRTRSKMAISTYNNSVRRKESESPQDMIWWFCTHGYTKVFFEALTIFILSADALDLLATCTGLETLKIDVGLQSLKFESPGHSLYFSNAVSFICRYAYYVSSIPQSSPLINALLTLGQSKMSGTIHIILLAMHHPAEVREPHPPPALRKTRGLRSLRFSGLFLPYLLSSSFQG